MENQKNATPPLSVPHEKIAKSEWHNRENGALFEPYSDFLGCLQN